MSWGYVQLLVFDDGEQFRLAFTATQLRVDEPTSSAKSLSVVRNSLDISEQPYVEAGGSRLLPHHELVRCCL